MKTLLSLLLAVLAAGCVNQAAKTGKGSGCCGLSEAQWRHYKERAADAVLDPVAWQNVGTTKPKAVQPTSRTDLFGSANSPDGVQPPTQVDVHVPIGSSVKDCTHVVVEFSHPGGTIKAMHATRIRYF